MTTSRQIQTIFTLSLSLISSLALQSCGSSGQHNLNPKLTAAEIATKEHEAKIDLAIRNRAQSIEGQVNTALTTILSPKNISAQIKISKIELVDREKDFAFDNLKFVQTQIQLKASSPNPYPKIQKLLDSKMESMDCTINYDRAAGLMGIAETKVDVFKLVEIESAGWLKPTKMEQVLGIVQFIDPFKTSDINAYVFDSASDSIKATKEVKDIARFDGSIVRDKVSVTAATKDVTTLKSHPLFQAYESIVLAYLKTQDFKDLEDAIRRFAETFKDS